MTRTELAAHVAASTSLAKSDAGAAVRAVFSAIANALARGDTATIAGFGAFATRSRPPRTGERIAIAASTAPSFKPAKALREAVNE
jgi:DNA-binding protein HU-beta